MDAAQMQKTLWAIGIDFGTTKTIVASFPRTTDKERIKPSFHEYGNTRITDDARKDAVPTVIAIHTGSVKNTGDIKFLVGKQAANLQERDYNNYCLVTDLKRRLMATDSNERIIRINDQYAEVEGVAASFLWKVLSSLQNLNLKNETYGISISVPAKAHLVQRMSTKFAAAITGFEQKIDIVEEPVAAFLYHKHLQPTYFEAARSSRFALVVDFGGGTCDLAVVEYSDGILPKVRGRAMGIFGGQVIDRLLVEKLWLDNESKQENILHLSSREFAKLLDYEKWKILEKARSVKELLSVSNTGLSMDITGGSPSQSGQINTPWVTTSQLIKVLETDEFTADHEGVPDSVTASLKGHIENLVARVLDNAEIRRSAISTLIFAGGSVSLPGVKNWVVNFLCEDAGKGPKNTQIKDNSIFSSDNLQCVAGGAAVHQLYRYHQLKKWSGAITPTLSENIWMVNGHPNESKRKSVLLAKKLEELPKNGRSYLTGKEIFPAVTYQKDGKEIFEVHILQGELNNPTIRIDYSFEDFFKAGLASFLPNANGVLIRYFIDDYELIEELLLTPGNLVTSWSWRRTKVAYNILTEEGTGEIKLRNIDASNRKEVERLRKIFIPGAQK